MTLAVVATGRTWRSSPRGMPRRVRPGTRPRNTSSGSRGRRSPASGTAPSRSGPTGVSTTAASTSAPVRSTTQSARHAGIGSPPVATSVASNRPTRPRSGSGKPSPPTVCLRLTWSLVPGLPLSVWGILPASAAGAVRPGPAGQGAAARPPKAAVIPRPRGPGPRHDIEISLRRRPSADEVRRLLAAGYSPEAARERWGSLPTYLIRDAERVRTRGPRAAKQVDRPRT